MINFAIQYPETEVTVLGRITTPKEEWDKLEYPTKVILLGSFVNNLIPEYEYCAVDFIPTADKPWEQDIRSQHVVMTCELIDSALQFTLERRLFIPCSLIKV